MSTGMNSDKRETLDYRARFARRWQRVIRQNFNSPAQVARAFSVDVSTAENWWDGANAPQGWVIGRAMMDPALRDEVIDGLTEGAA